MNMSSIGFDFQKIIVDKNRLPTGPITPEHALQLLTGLPFPNDNSKLQASQLLLLQLQKEKDQLQAWAKYELMKAMVAHAYQIDLLTQPSDSLASAFAQIGLQWASDYRNVETQQKVHAVLHNTFSNSVLAGGLSPWIIAKQAEYMQQQNLVYSSEGADGSSTATALGYVYQIIDQQMNYLHNMVMVKKTSIDGSTSATTTKATKKRTASKEEDNGAEKKRAKMPDNVEVISVEDDDDDDNTEEEEKKQPAVQVGIVGDVASKKETASTTKDVEMEETEIKEEEKAEVEVEKKPAATGAGTPTASPAPKKRGRGRPRKNAPGLENTKTKTTPATKAKVSPKTTTLSKTKSPTPAKRGRGRPRKNPPKQEATAPPREPVAPLLPPNVPPATTSVEPQNKSNRQTAYSTQLMQEEILEIPMPPTNNTGIAATPSFDQSPNQTFSPEEFTSTGLRQRMQTSQSQVQSQEIETEPLPMMEDEGFLHESADEHTSMQDEHLAVDQKYFLDRSNWDDLSNLHKGMALAAGICLLFVACQFIGF